MSALDGLVAGDPHDDALLHEVRPADWHPPAPRARYDLVVIGGGTGGLVTAVGAAGLGAQVALIERALLGGDCLNVGCVPSKALIRAGRAAYDARTAAELGVRAGAINVDFAAVMARLRRTRAGIAPHDSAARLAGLGIHVFLGDARFVARDTIEVGEHRLRFARAVIATGARAAALPIPGLIEAGYLTNESVFGLTERPRRLLVIGGGPIGCELAQAFRRLGSEVVIIDLGERILAKDDPDASAIVQRRLAAESIELVLAAKIVRVEGGELGRAVVVDRGNGEERLVGDAILVAAGRVPNIDGLGLEVAGVVARKQGVEVDDRLRTSNRRILAVGDVASRYQFAHAADALARIAIQNALFFGRKRASALVVPWCTYTDPEVAHVGLTASDAAERRDVTTFTIPLEEVDRAIIDGAAEGFARVHADRKGRILGATLVSRHAGESIGELVLAMTTGTRLGALAGVIHPYPTEAEAIRKLGDAFQRGRLTPAVRWILEKVLRWRR